MNIIFFSSVFPGEIGIKNIESYYNIFFYRMFPPILAWSLSILLP